MESKQDLKIYQYPSTWEGTGIIKEAKFKSSLSGGKGGQHVNKVSTKAELYWNPALSKALPEEVKAKILTKLGSKLSQEGELRLVSDEERSLGKNKEKVTEKFYKLLASCFKEKKKRKATKPTKTSVQKRLEGKGKRKQLKEGRKKPDF